MVRRDPSPLSRLRAVLPVPRPVERTRPRRARSRPGKRMGVEGNVRRSVTSPQSMAIFGVMKAGAEGAELAAPRWANLRRNYD